MCTSLQSIVNVYDRSRMEKDIQQLFKQRAYPLFELRQFYKHELFENNEQFNFFLDILQEWNRKIQNQQLPVQSDTLFHKNTFVFNTLKNSIMQKKESAEKVLNHLYNWFNTTRNRKIKNVERKIKEEQEDEDWKIRNTFKSNLPAEIDLYRRRVCCKNQLEIGNNKEIENQPENNESQKDKKVQGWVHENTIKSLGLKRTAVIENEVIRFQKEAKQLEGIQKRWKVKKMRQQEGGIRNYYNGKFLSCKTYFPKKQQKQNLNLYSMRRLKTSTGVREKKGSTGNIRHSEGGQSRTIGKRNSQQLTLFDDFEEKKVGQIVGLRLMSGPPEVKIKKKKRVK